MVEIALAGVETGAKIAELSAELGIVERVKQKLVKEPDAAASKLAAVLEELQKAYLAFESELVQFLAVTLEPGPDLRHDLAALYALEGQGLWARLSATRGHCRKIGGICETHLSPWFQRVTALDKRERAELEQLFSKLNDADETWVTVLNTAAYWLTQRASEVLDAYEAGDVARANTIVAAARREILPMRRQLADALAQMRQLEADFIEVGAISG